MTKIEELKNRIEELKDREHDRDMKDFWSSADYEYSFINRKTIAELEKELRNLEAQEDDFR